MNSPKPLNPVSRRGVLLVNLGTPDSHEPKDVQKYLAQFLMDPYVIDLPWFARWLLVHGIILRTRPKKSAEAYKTIWTQSGSPLLSHSQGLSKEVGSQLNEVPVKLGMRYGNPSLGRALKEFEENRVNQIAVIPLYPQFAESTTQTLIDELERLNVQTHQGQLQFAFQEAFFARADFLEAWRQVYQESLRIQPEHILFSFHGLPERHILRTDPTRHHCLKTADCCDRWSQTPTHREQIPNCYRAQCFATARGIAQSLRWPQNQYTISFQSRLGRTPWIQPYTDETLRRLATQGIRRLAVLCPAFVADCLETLEEIAERGRETFVQAGGQEFQMIPSLNSHPLWVQTVAKMARETLAALPH